MSKSAALAKKVGSESTKKSGQTSQHYEWEYAKPPEDLTTSDKIKRYFHDPAEGTYCGRTPIMWVKLLVAYTVLYILIAILFTICMYGLLLSIDKDRPTYVLTESLIGINPGLGFRPLPANFEEGNSIIVAKPSDKNNTDRWIQRIETFLQAYKSPPKKKGARQVCDYDSPPGNGKVCDVNVDSPDWGVCRAARQYGFATSSPCVFIKLNRIFDWIPQYYNNTNELPEDMPDDLQNHIRHIKDKRLLNTIWVSCHGESPADVENIGPVEILPRRGFPGYYYPYTNQEGYLSPLVAVHFRRPAMHTLIAVECRIWTKQSVYRKNIFRGGEGMVHFELMLD